MRQSIQLRWILLPSTLWLGSFKQVASSQQRPPGTDDPSYKSKFGLSCKNHVNVQCENFGNIGFNNSEVEELLQRCPVSCADESTHPTKSTLRPARDKTATIFNKNEGEENDGDGTQAHRQRDPDDDESGVLANTCFTGRCSDDPDYMSKFLVPCTIHDAFECGVLQAVGFTPYEVWELMERCPCSCKTDCRDQLPEPTSFPTLSSTEAPTSAHTLLPSLAPTLYPTRTFAPTDSTQAHSPSPTEGTIMPDDISIVSSIEENFSVIAEALGLSSSREVLLFMVACVVAAFVIVAIAYRCIRLQAKRRVQRQSQLRALRAADHKHHSNKMKSITHASENKESGHHQQNQQYSGQHEQTRDHHDNNRGIVVSQPCVKRDSSWVDIIELNIEN